MERGPSRALTLFSNDNLADRATWSAGVSLRINLHTVHDLYTGLRYYSIQGQEHVMIATKINSRENFRASGLLVSFSLPFSKWGLIRDFRIPTHNHGKAVYTTYASLRGPQHPEDLPDTGGHLLGETHTPKTRRMRRVPERLSIIFLRGCC